MSIAKAPIGNAIESVAPDHVVTTADQIYDEALGKYQSEINQEGGGGGGNTADVNYDTTNKKITKTIDGVTSDVVTVATLKTDMNLGNVGNFKAVSTVENQGLSNTEKSNARTNIGAGTSNFSGSYNDLSNKPTIPCADKSYTPLAHSGLGRKNLELKDGGNNILAQEDFNAANTIYVIQYDFDLDNTTITMPANCVLEFDGGSVTNGKVLSSSTRLIGANKYAGVLNGIYYTMNGQLVNGKGRIYNPDLGFDYAFNQYEVLPKSISFTCLNQGIIDVGDSLFVFSNQDGGARNFIFKFDKYFNSQGYVELSSSQIAHGGTGYYLNDYVYVASHTDNSIIRFAVSTIKNAANGTLLTGTKVTIDALQGKRVDICTYDYNTNTIGCWCEGQHAYILNTNYEVLAYYQVDDNPEWDIYMWIQGITLEDGVMTCFYSDVRGDCAKVSSKFDIYNKTTYPIMTHVTKVDNIELEGICKDTQTDDYYVVANHFASNTLLIGRYSEYRTLETLDKSVSGSRMLSYYVNNSATQKPPMGNSYNPFRNIASAIVFSGTDVDIRLASTGVPYVWGTVLCRGKHISFYADASDVNNFSTYQTITGSIKFEWCSVSFVQIKVSGYLDFANIGIFAHTSTVSLYRVNVVKNTDYTSTNAITIASGTLIITRVYVEDATVGISVDSAVFRATEIGGFTNCTTAYKITSPCTLNISRIFKNTFTNCTTYLNLDAPNMVDFKLNSSQDFTDVRAFLQKSSVLSSNVCIHVDFNVSGGSRYDKGHLYLDQNGNILNGAGHTLMPSMTTANRQAVSTSTLLVGDYTYDSDLKKPVWWTGDTSSGKSGWVDGKGENVPNS